MHELNIIQNTDYVFGTYLVSMIFVQQKQWDVIIFNLKATRNHLGTNRSECNQSYIKNYNYYVNKNFLNC